MEEQCSPLGCGWAYYYQEEGVDVLKQSLLYSTLELEAAVVSAHDEISRKDDEILQLKALLSKIIKERDEFQANSRDLALEKQLLFQQLQILAHSSDQRLDPCATTNDIQDDRILDTPPSDRDNSNIVNAAAAAAAAAAAGGKDTMSLTPPPPPLVLDVTDVISLKRPLPELGKFHQAVMEAGPLLQTLLLAGPLPRWQHPPPQLNSVDIPPVTISSPPATKSIISPDSCLISPTTNKRTAVNWDIPDFQPSSKYQKVCSPMIVDPEHTT